MNQGGKGGSFKKVKLFQKAEGGGQKPEIRSRQPEDRNQRSEVRTSTQIPRVRLRESVVGTPIFVRFHCERRVSSSSQDWSKLQTNNAGPRHQQDRLTSVSRSLSVHKIICPQGSSESAGLARHTVSPAKPADSLVSTHHSITRVVNPGRHHRRAAPGSSRARSWKASCPAPRPRCMNSGSGCPPRCAPRSPAPRRRRSG